MGSFELTDSERFPVGTTVYIYPAEQTKAGAGPTGQYFTSKVMTAEGITFDGLDETIEYAAYALVNGRHINQHFRAEPDYEVVFSDRGRIEALEQQFEDQARLKDLENIKDWMTIVSTDDRGETYPNGLRRWTRLTRPHGASRIPGAVEAYRGMVESATVDGIVQTTETSDEDTDDVWVNSTSAALSTLFLARYAQHTGRSDLIPVVDEFARALVRLQWDGIATSTDKFLRKGGFMLGASDGRTGPFNTGLCGRALFESYKATGASRYLTAATAAADYLMRCADPNTAYAAYSVTPINRTVNGVTWYGFVDRIDSVDKVSTVSSTWNLVAARFLYEFGQYVGEDTYVTTATQVRDFMAYGALNGYDIFAPQTNLATGKLTTGIDTDDTTIVYTVTGPTAFPVSYPFTLTFGGETMIATGSPGAGQLTVTRGSVPRSFGAEALFGILDTYVSATWTTSSPHTWNDHGWHRYGASANPTTGTTGTDPIEYGLPALYAMGYNRKTLRDAYTHFRDLPHPALLTGNGLPAAEQGSDGGVFGGAYDGAFCWAGYFRLGTEGINGRPDRVYGAYYDFQGAGTLGGFKAKEFPQDFNKSRQELAWTIYRGSLLNGSRETLWSTGATTDSTKRGSIVVASAGLALLDAIEGVV